VAGDVATDTEQAFRRLPGSVGHRDVVSTLSQFTGDGQADSPVAAGDQYRARHRKAPHFPAAAVISHDVGLGVWERIAAYRATDEYSQPGPRGRNPRSTVGPPGGGFQTQCASWARIAACTLLLMSSLDRIRLTCALTVASRIPRSRPASALELPWAMATRTERSRSLSTDSRCSAHLRPSAEPAGAGSAKRSNIRLVTLGASMALPSWTVRTAEIRSRGGVSLSKKPTAPARSAACTYSSRSKVVSRTTRGASGSAVSRLAAVIPSVPGMRMSSRITSGERSSASRTASSPSSPSPTTSMSGAASRIMRNPDLTRVSSSIRSVRITGGFLVFRGRCLFLDGHHSAHAPPTVGACPDGELSPDKSKAFSESGQTET